MKSDYLRMSDASSTRMISVSNSFGDLSIIEWTVLSSMDQASLWKQTITLVEGKLLACRPGALHLQEKKTFLMCSIFSQTKVKIQTRTTTIHNEKSFNEAGKTFYFDRS